MYAQNMSRPATLGNSSRKDLEYLKKVIRTDMLIDLAAHCEHVGLFGDATWIRTDCLDPHPDSEYIRAGSMKDINRIIDLRNRADIDRMGFSSAFYGQHGGIENWTPETGIPAIGAAGSHASRRPRPQTAMTDSVFDRGSTPMSLPIRVGSSAGVSSAFGPTYTPVGNPLQEAMSAAHRPFSSQQVMGAPFRPMSVQQAMSVSSRPMSVQQAMSASSRPMSVQQVMSTPPGRVVSVQQEMASLQGRVPDIPNMISPFSDQYQHEITEPRFDGNGRILIEASVYTNDGVEKVILNHNNLAEQYQDLAEYVKYKNTSHGRRAGMALGAFLDIVQIGRQAAE